jgi:hypothetical protein
MILAPWASSNASVGASASVKAESEVLRVNIVYYVFHAVGEVVLLRIEKTRGIATTRPTIIQMKVAVTSIIESHIYKSIRGRQYTELVAVVKHRVLWGWPKGDPAGPAECGKTRVRCTIVITESNTRKKKEREHNCSLK